MRALWCAFDMSLFQIIILAIIQGLTEFVPISSSGHLVALRAVFGWSDKSGILLDTVLHAGSLLAILMYFWKEWVRWIKSYGNRYPEDRFYRWLPVYLIVATIPIAVAGPLSEGLLERARSGPTVGIIMIAAAVWFVICEKWKQPPRKFTVVTALAVGAAQVFALLPGASRSGLTTGAGLLMGRRRTDAASFAFLMGIPAIGGAVLYQSRDIAHCAENGLNPLLLGVGFLVCFAVSLASIHGCLKFFKKHGLPAFAVYLGVLGMLLIALS